MITPAAPDFLDVFSNALALFALFSGMVTLLCGVNVAAFLIDAVVELGIVPLVEL